MWQDVKSELRDVCTSRPQPLDKKYLFSVNGDLTWRRGLFLKSTSSSLCLNDFRYKCECLRGSAARSRSVPWKAAGNVLAGGEQLSVPFYFLVCHQNCTKQISVKMKGGSMRKNPWIIISDINMWYIMSLCVNNSFVGQIRSISLNSNSTFKKYSWRVTCTFHVGFIYREPPYRTQVISRNR